MHSGERPVVLVTGGAGYIGAHCAKALSEAGFLPVAYDNLSTGHESFVRWGPLVRGDIRDTGEVLQALRTHGAVAVMHFAAFSLVGESVCDPQKYYLNNLAGTLSLLQAMREAGCHKLVFSSTGAVYGNDHGEPIVETSRCEPINPYGRSKLAIEHILSDYRSAYDFRSFCLRYFNASGADPSGQIGELREVETHLIPRAMMAIQGHVADFAVFGTDYATPDGTAIRDYIHVTDLAAAHVLALRQLLAGVKGGSYNLGTGTGYSVRQILDVIALETGFEVPHTLHERRQGDPAVLVADASAVRRAFGFHPVHSDLSVIVRTAWNWHCHAHPRREGQLALS
jgi:UDP-glucose 4-epimerase